MERNSIIFVEKKPAVCAGIDGDGERARDFFIDILFDGTERENRALADEKRKRLKVHGAFHFASTFETLAGPKIEPASAREVEAARGGPNRCKRRSRWGRFHRCSNPKAGEASRHDRDNGKGCRKRRIGTSASRALR